MRVRFFLKGRIKRGMGLPLFLSQNFKGDEVRF